MFGVSLGLSARWMDAVILHSSVKLWHIYVGVWFAIYSFQQIFFINKRLDILLFQIQINIYIKIVTNSIDFNFRFMNEQIYYFDHFNIWNETVCQCLSNFCNQIFQIQLLVSFHHTCYSCSYLICSTFYNFSLNLAVVILKWLKIR